MFNDGSKLTLTMIVKNEANRYLRRALEAHRSYIDEAVIIDNGSTDRSVEICREVLEGIPLQIISNTWASFSNERELRGHQWNETLACDPEWILNMDADEWFEDGAAERIRALLKQRPYDAVYFRLYDMWNETHYREDTYWRAHTVYRPFLIRHVPGREYAWKEAALHGGRFPETIHHFSYHLDSLRVRHYGWSREEDRIAKYQRYLQLDPNGVFGWKEQYESILDKSPVLIEWEG